MLYQQLEVQSFRNNRSKKSNEQNPRDPITETENGTLNEVIGHPNHSLESPTNRS